MLIVDGGTEQRPRWVRLCAAAALEATTIAQAEDAQAALRGEPPALILYDVDGTGDGLLGLRKLRESRHLRDVPVLAMSADQSETFISEAFETGADDVIRRPIGEKEFVARVKAHVRLQQSVDELSKKERDAQVMLELTQALASSLDFREILFTVVRRIAEVVNVARASIVLAPEPEQGNVGYVVVASDDERLSNLRIDLSQYPEIQEVIRTQESLTVNDVRTHPVLDAVRDRVPSEEISSMTLLPIVWQDHALGVLFLRATSRRSGLTPRELHFCRIVANATAVALRNARVMQSLRDHTQQVTFARFEAERRLRSLERYADLFDSVSDGIAVIDTAGRLLFANPCAYELLGHERDVFRGGNLFEIIVAEEQDSARRAWERFREGGSHRDVDLRLKKKDGTSMVASISASPLLHGEGAVLITFRDVTEHRLLEAELVRTKEFLESLIDASVDGIVAWDTSQTIILFSEGSERIFGRAADEVLKKTTVKELFPADGFDQVMAMVRSSQHGGVGRLQSTRLEALGQGDERIPISLSAAVIHQDGEPTASFGIFTDLRDRLRVEERLVAAQQKLAVTEKQALIAELAGTAAHELNQPLTSVMGYAEMLKRKLPREEGPYQAADIIVREAERMADIVRKIGKITKYETKSYVGRQRILDLDRASDTGETAGES